jgi:hypothetical protein
MLLYRQLQRDQNSRSERRELTFDEAGYNYCYL